MRDDLVQYYITLYDLLKKYKKQLGVKLKLKELRCATDAMLFPCLKTTTHNFYLTTKYDIRKNKFGKFTNETIITIRRGKHIVIFKQ